MSWTSQRQRLPLAPCRAKFEAGAKAGGVWFLALPGLGGGPGRAGRGTQGTAALPLADTWQAGVIRPPCHHTAEVTLFKVYHFPADFSGSRAGWGQGLSLHFAKYLLGCRLLEGSVSARGRLGQEGTLPLPPDRQLLCSLGLSPLPSPLRVCVNRAVLSVHLQLLVPSLARPFSFVGSQAPGCWCWRESPARRAQPPTPHSGDSLCTVPASAAPLFERPGSPRLFFFWFGLAPLWFLQLCFELQ